jgi:hypothetical protein
VTNVSRLATCVTSMLRCPLKQTCQLNSRAYLLTGFWSELIRHVIPHCIPDLRFNTVMACDRRRARAVQHNKGLSAEILKPLFTVLWKRNSIIKRVYSLDEASLNTLCLGRSKVDKAAARMAEVTEVNGESVSTAGVHLSLAFPPLSALYWHVACWPHSPTSCACSRLFLIICYIVQIFRNETICKHWKAPRGLVPG